MRCCGAAPERTLYQYAVMKMQLGTGETFLLLVLFLSVGHVGALVCYCNTTHNAPPPHCSGTANFTCNSNYQCLTHRFWSEFNQAIVSEWECLSSDDLLLHDLTAAYCSGAANSNESVTQCCNNTDLCNRYLHFELPIEEGGYTYPHHPTSLPAAQEGDSLICLIVGVPLITVIAVVTLLGTPIIVLIVLHFRMSIRQRKTRQQQTVPLRPNTYTRMSTLFDEITSSTASGMPLLSPRNISQKVEVGDIIANGRLGQVFVGCYQGETVAVKKFNLGNEQVWLREMEIYGKFKVQHENLLQFLACDVLTPSNSQGTAELWLVTQYHSNRSLFDYLQREVVSTRVMLQMATSTCVGLAYLHQEVKSGQHGKPPIAHRNITSKNVLVKSNLRCCIADFGLAVVKDGGVNGESLLIRAESLKEGTKRYMAPEILSETINLNYFESFKQVDIYALGLVLWEICRRCTGRDGSADNCEAYELPFQGLVPANPSLEDMQKLVVVERRQPGFTNRWSADEVLCEMMKVMHECWYFNSSARPTAAYFKKRLLKLSQKNPHDAK